MSRYGNREQEAPAWDAFSITPGASALTHEVRAVYVGVGGDVEVTTAAGNDVTFADVPQGAVLPVRATHVLATSTTASSLVGLY